MAGGQMTQPCAEKPGLGLKKEKLERAWTLKTQVIAGRGLNPDAAAGEV